jgi:hypothetical protein
VNFLGMPTMSPTGLNLIRKFDKQFWEDLTRARETGDKNFYLKNVPLTEEKMKKSKDKVEEAIFNMGYIYYEGLKDLKKSEEAFDTLLIRYPDGKFILKSYIKIEFNYQKLR